jgi:hypothetical protein
MTYRPTGDPIALSVVHPPQPQIQPPLGFTLDTPWLDVQREQRKLHRAYRVAQSPSGGPIAPRADNARRYRVLWSWDDLGYLAFAPLAWWQWPLYWLPMLIAHKQPVKCINRVVYPYPAEAWDALSDVALHRGDWHGYGYAKQQEQRCITASDYAGHAERLEYERLEPEFWRQTPPRNVWLSLVNTEPSWVRATYRE